MNSVRCTWNMPEEKPSIGCSPLMAREPFFLARQMVAVCHSPVPGTIHTTLATSVGDPWHFGADPDPHLWLMGPDPAPDQTPDDFKDEKKYFIFFLLTHSTSSSVLKILIFCWNFVLKFYFVKHYFSQLKSRIRIRTSDKRIRIQEARKHADPSDPDPKHCLQHSHISSSHSPVTNPTWMRSS